MNPIKYIKVKDNDYDFDTMTLVSIVSHNGELSYFFIAEFFQKFRGSVTLEKTMLQVPQDDFLNIISLYYKIA